MTPLLSHNRSPAPRGICQHRSPSVGGCSFGDPRRRPGRSTRIIPNAKRPARGRHRLKRGADALDCGSEPGPWHRIGQRCHFHQADCFARRKAIRRNYVKAPLPGIPVISVLVHNRVVGSSTQSAPWKYPFRVRISNIGTVAFLVPVQVCREADCFTSRSTLLAGCSNSQPRQSPEHNRHSAPRAAPTMISAISPRQMFEIKGSPNAAAQALARISSIVGTDDAATIECPQSKRRNSKAFD